MIAFVVLSLSLHEAAHAWAANALGDPTAKLQGRMTWNPLVHIDPWMTLILPTLSILLFGFLFGGARPVPVDPRNFKNAHRDNALVAIAGPLSNFLLALVFMGAWIGVLTLTDYTGDQLLPAVLRATALANVILAVFNLIPLLPLDGGHVSVVWYEGLRRRLARLRGRPDPGAVDMRRLMPLTYGVAALLITSSLLLLWADLVNPISLP